MTKLLSSANLKIGSVLAKILEEHYLGVNNNDIICMDLDVLLSDLDINIVQLGQIFTHLREQKIIKSFTLPFPDVFEDGKVHNNNCYFTVPKDFRTVSDNYINKLSQNKDIHSTSALYLDNTGNLSHGDNAEYCYSMGATSNRLAIIKYLAQNKGFQHTNLISSALNNKDEQNIRTEISKIKQKIKGHLMIDDLIESKKDSGYRINPKYQIFFK